MNSRSRMNRRQFAVGIGIGGLLPGALNAAPAREITWDDLIPEGVPYGEIIGTGQMDAINDTWIPEYDRNASRLNMELSGTVIRLPGYIIPFDMGSEGVSSFMLVPYVGACIHVPPPPPNQLVFVTTKTPWAGETLWVPVWVQGVLQAKPMETQIADVGYQVAADKIETYP